jgi:hypothetical protein
MGTDDPTVPPPRKRPLIQAPRQPPILRPGKAPGSQDSHPVLSDEQAKRFWEELQSVEERVLAAENERGRDLARYVSMQERVDTLGTDMDEVWREVRSMRKRLDASIQDDVVTARQIGDLEKRLAVRAAQESERLSARADLAAEEVAGPLAARTGSKAARKWAALVTGLGLLVELLRWYFASQGK